MRCNNLNGSLNMGLAEKTLSLELAPLEVNSYVKSYRVILWTDGGNVKQLMSKPFVRNDY